jgi:hypothetical protein
VGVQGCKTAGVNDLSSTHSCDKHRCGSEVPGSPCMAVQHTAQHHVMPCSMLQPMFAVTSTCVHLRPRVASCHSPSPAVHAAGTLPASWSNMTKLGIMRLFQNQLEGTLPAAWSSLPVTELRLDTNRLQVRWIHQCGVGWPPAPENGSWQNTGFCTVDTVPMCTLQPPTTHCYTWHEDSAAALCCA